MTRKPPPRAEIAPCRLLAAPGQAPVRRGAGLRIAQGRIAEIFDAGAAGGDRLVLPALVNAHDHGRGLRRHAYGAVDEALESWLPASSALHPPVDPYLVAAAAFAQMAGSGIGTVVHCHMPQRWDRLIDEAEAVCRAASEIGLRLAFVVPMADRNRLSYDGDEPVIARLAPEDREAVRARWLRPAPPPAEQVALVEAIAARFESETVNVQFGPFGAEWASEDMLERIAEASARTGRRVHMHCQETVRQRAWADRRPGGGLFAYLDRIGLLSPRLTLAHGVWIRPDEAALLAERGVTVAINTSSNLRLRSGIAPLREFLKAGTPIAFGLDALALDDDADMLRELRLAWRLHAGFGGQDGLTLRRLYEAAAGIGAFVALDSKDYGRIAPGAPADLVVLDYAAMAADRLETGAGEEDVLLARACRRHVREVIVAGRAIVADGDVTGIDAPAIERELLAQARAGTGTVAAGAPLVARLQAAIRAHYAAQG